MDRRWLLTLPGIVFLNSLLGLWRPISEDFSGWNWQIMTDVWTASWAGDAVFTIGTVACAAFTAGLVVRSDHWRWAAPVAWPIVSTVVYWLAWQITGRAGGSEGDDLTLRFVIEMGWVGLLVPAIGLAAFLLIRGSRAELPDP